MCVCMCVCGDTSVHTVDVLCQVYLCLMKFYHCGTG